MKFKNFYLLLILIALWTGFFGLYKYFFWSVFQDSLFLTLEEIAWYLAFGSFFAYIIGSLLYSIFKEKLSLIFSTIGIVFILWSFYVFEVHSKSWIWILTLMSWFFYGFWGVLKNIMISQEIERTGKNDTFVNGFANIAFFVFIILWSIGGWLIYENFWKAWVLWIVWIITIAGVLWMMVQQDTKTEFKNTQKLAKTYISKYLPNFLYVIQKNFLVMLICSLYLVIATILSQKAIAYSVDFLWKTNSEASTLLLYSAVGTIIWNFITMRIQKNRWFYAAIFSWAFAILIFIFPFLMKNFMITALLAFVSGVFFWINYNLVESYFLLKIWQQGKREYGSASYWIVTSICLSWLMFLTYYFETFLWFKAIFMLWWCVVVIIAFILWFKNKIL